MLDIMNQVAERMATNGEEISPTEPSLEADGYENWEVWRVICGRDCRGRFVRDGEIDSFILDHVSPRVDAFTVYSANGYWKGKPEAVTIFEIAGMSGGQRIAYEIAVAYRGRFSQECVMVSRSTADVKFV